jgi:hypothetical protein
VEMEVYVESNENYDMSEVYILLDKTFAFNILFSNESEDVYDFKCMNTEGQSKRSDLRAFAEGKNNRFNFFGDANDELNLEHIEDELIFSIKNQYHEFCNYSTKWNSKDIFSLIEVLDNHSV